MSDPKKPDFRALLSRLAQGPSVSDAELIERDRKHHEEIQLSLLGSRLDQWGVTVKEKNAVLGRGPVEWRETPATKWARHLAKSDGERAMVLWGGKGCGKSVASALWLSLAARRPIRGHPRLGDTWEWDETCKLVSPGEIGRRYNSFDHTDKHWAEDLRRCRALVLDDFGSGGRDVTAEFGDVVYERNRRDLFTVITTNLNPDEFAAKYDARVADRLLQDGHFRACGAENLREESMNPEPEFKPFPKIARFSREVIVTEKIDGTNESVWIGDDGSIRAASRTRWITPADDNFGFAAWVETHKSELLALGPGSHFGEWWGSGIQRGYGLPKGERRFSLFNVGRWAEEGLGPPRVLLCGSSPLARRLRRDAGQVDPRLPLGNRKQGRAGLHEAGRHRDSSRRRVRELQEDHRPRRGTQERTEVARRPLPVESRRRMTPNPVRVGQVWRDPDGDLREVVFVQPDRTLNVGVQVKNLATRKGDVVRGLAGVGVLAARARRAGGGVILEIVSFVGGIIGIAAFIAQQAQRRADRKDAAYRDNLATRAAALLTEAHADEARFRRLIGMSTPELLVDVPLTVEEQIAQGWAMRTNGRANA